MMKHFVVALGWAVVFMLPAWAVNPWTAVLSRPVPRAYPSELRAEGVTGVMLEGEPYQGKETRFFAWYGLPKAAAATNKVPAMVLIHGGEGTAYDWWVRYWNEQGYAAVAMDTCGALPVKDPGTKKWRRHEHSGPAGWGGFATVEGPDADQWTYHAVAAVLRAHTYLAALPEVDATRVGVTGISWGGYLTCIVAGVDPRLKWAVPVYGCGFYGDGSEWAPLLVKMGPRGEKWLATWDASVYLKDATCPFLWVSGTTDRFFKVPMLQKSAALTKGPKFFNIRPTMTHGHQAGSSPWEIRNFANHFAFGTPLAPSISTQWEVRPSAQCP